MPRDLAHAAIHIVHHYAIKVCGQEFDFELKDMTNMYLEAQTAWFLLFEAHKTNKRKRIDEMRERKRPLIFQWTCHAEFE